MGAQCDRCGLRWAGEELVCCVGLAGRYFWQ